MTRKIKDPIVTATTRVSVATRAFADAAEALEAAADELTALAVAAENEANVQNLRAGGARTEAHTARTRAARIRELLA